MSEQKSGGFLGISQSNKSAMRNPWVLGWLAMVALVFAINAFMVGQAYISSPGLVNEQYYDKGENYHQTLARRNEVEALGWQVNLDRPLRPALNDANIYRLVAVDAAGLPLAGADVEFVAYRPADQKADFTLPMSEEAPGIYRADVRFPLKGMWDVVVSLKKDGHNYELPERTKVWD